MDSWLAPDTDALQLDTRSAARHSTSLRAGLIAPCQSVLSPGDPLLILLRGEGGNDLFETRVAAQRIPKRQQFQFAVTEEARPMNRDRELFVGEIFVANPCSDHRQIFNHALAIEGVFRRRKKLDSAPAFSQCVLFPPKGSIDQTKHAQRWTVVWLGLDDFLLLGARRSESEPRFAFVFSQASDNAFDKWPAELNRTIPEWSVAHGDQGILCGSGVALGQCADKPRIAGARQSSGVPDSN